MPRLRTLTAGKPTSEVGHNRPAAAPAAAAPPPTGKTGAGQPAEAGNVFNDYLWGTKRRQGMVEATLKSASRTMGSQLGRGILRGVLGGILGGSRKR